LIIPSEKDSLLIVEGLFCHAADVFHMVGGKDIVDTAAVGTPNGILMAWRFAAFLVFKSLWSHSDRYDIIPDRLQRAGRTRLVHQAWGCQRPVRKW